MIRARRRRLREAFIQGYKKALKKQRILEAAGRRGRRRKEQPHPTNFKPRQEKWYDRDTDTRGLDEICFDYLEDLYKVYKKDYEGIINSLKYETDNAFNMSIRYWENRYIQEIEEGQHDDDEYAEVPQRYIQRAVYKFLRKHNIFSLTTVFGYKNLDEELHEALYSKTYDSIYKLHHALHVADFRH